jgi:hypothetical protein
LNDLKCTIDHRNKKPKTSSKANFQSYTKLYDMANAAANLAGKMMGDATETSVTTEVSNPGKNPAWADPSGEKMQALAWFGKNDVRVIETFKPAIMDPEDVIIKVTGSTICGSDLHLYHGSIIQMQKGDILGYGLFIS